jgi:GrpB-like predicted nucleotidyltransferase (UPF0157 family)
MKILTYKKIAANFSPWSPVYCDVAQAVINFISLERFEVIHIGSTSFNVGGKGIIDLALLYRSNELALATQHLLTLGFQDQINAKPFPKERPRKDGAVNVNGKEYYFHIHVIANKCDEHKELLRYKNYMLDNANARKAYEDSKKIILSEGFINQDVYGKKKSPFVKAVLKKLNTKTY